MRTWGQIRQILRQRFPALPMDLLTSAIVTAYNNILDLQDWTQLEVSGQLRTLPKVDTTGNVANGSITVTGTGFLADWVGRWIQFGTDTSRYRITEYNIGDVLLDRPYEGPTANAQKMMIYQPIYSLPADTKTIREFPEISQRWTRQDYDANATPNLTGTPIAWLSLEGDEMEQKQVELYPAPVDGKSFAYRYIRSPRRFDGVNTHEYPLSWVSDDAILAHATASCCAEPSEQQDPTFYLAQYAALVDRMYVVDGKRQSYRLRVESRMTRHDAERQAR